MLHPILAKLSAHPAFADALSFILTGFILVIGALLVLSGLISLIGKAFRMQEAKAKSGAGSKAAMPVPVSSGVSAPAPAASPEPDIPLPALIAAAVHVALDGQAHRVVHIEPVSIGWAREGRREIFSSHRVR